MIISVQLIGSNTINQSHFHKESNNNSLFTIDHSQLTHKALFFLA